MDSLDLNVHSAILISLAQCYATHSPREEPLPILAKLPASVLADRNHLNLESNGSVELTSSHSSSLEEVTITHCRAHYIIANAAFISQSAVTGVPVASKEIKWLCNMLKNLFSWTVELNLATENIAEWPLVDEITYRLVLAVLQIGSLSTPSDVERLVDALSTSITQLSHALINASPFRIATHIFPSLSGMRRALGSGCFPFTIAHFNKLFSPITKSKIFSITTQSKEYIDSPLGPSSESNLMNHQSLQLEDLKARYVAVGFPLSANLAVLAGLQQCRNVLEQCSVSFDPASSTVEPRNQSSDGGWARLKQSANERIGVGLTSESLQY